MSDSRDPQQLVKDLNNELPRENTHHFMYTEDGWTDAISAFDHETGMVIHLWDSEDGPHPVTRELIRGAIQDRAARIGAMLPKHG